MPALTNLRSRIIADITWERESDASLPKADAWARKMPLLHVFGTGNSFARMVLRDEHLQPTGPHSRTSTLEAEAVLGCPPCVYLYAGRAFPARGGIALVFEPAREVGREGDATPFDIGGLIHKDRGTGHRFIHSNLPDTTAAIQTFVVDSKLKLDQWREGFRDFLAAYFSPVEQYFFGRPSRTDPEGLFANPGNTWRAWTFEVHFFRSLPVTDASHWCGSKQTMDLYNEQLEEALPSDRDRLERFLSCAWSKTGYLQYVAEVERRVIELLS